MAALPAVAGSAISFLLVIFIIWSIISIASGRLELRLSASDKVLASAFSLHVGMILLTGLAGGNRGALAGSTYWLIPFLGLWLLLPRLRASPQLDYLGLFVKGAVIGALAALAFAVVEVTALHSYRAEGGAGNAIIFAAMALCLAGIAGLGIRRGDGSISVVNLLAVVAGFGAVALSLSRGVFLAIPAILLCLMLSARNHGTLIRRVQALVIAAGAGGVLLAPFYSIFHRRLVLTMQEFERFGTDGYSANIGERLRLWAAAWRAFLESPVWGYGIQNRMDVLLPDLIADGHTVTRFSHAHNAYLSAALDGGVLAVAALLTMLAAPVVVAWRAPRDHDYRRRLFLAVILVTCYALIGLTQVLFKHDIMDSFYIFACAIIGASIPAGPETATGTPAQRNPDETG